VRPGQARPATRTRHFRNVAGKRASASAWQRPLSRLPAESFKQGQSTVFQTYTLTPDAPSCGALSPLFDFDAARVDLFHTAHVLCDFDRTLLFGVGVDVAGKLDDAVVRRHRDLETIDVARQHQ
jgi:hypothetical protein